jgi:hypothetical protein
MKYPKTWLLALGLLAFQTIYSQSLQQLPKPYLEPGDLFGASVDINGQGTWIVVGAPFHRNFTANEWEGAAYIYNLSGGNWALQDTLRNPALTDWDQFGTAVSINTDGNFVAVGAPRAGSQYRGDASLFKYNGTGWDMLAPLQHNGNGGLNTGASQHDLFGAALSIDGSGYYLAAGSPGHHNQMGRANVCYYDPLALNWTHYAAIPNPGPDKGDFFGAALVVDPTANFLVIGAPGEDNGIGGKDNITDQYGAVYYYQRDPNTQNTWNLVQKVYPTGLQPQSMFGTSVALDQNGQTLIVGAPGHDGNGAAFLFEMKSGLWELSGQISAYNPGTDDGFGISVALSGPGDLALVGAPARDTAGLSGVGSAFLFQDQPWKQFRNFSLPPGYEAAEGFGSALALSRSVFSGVISSPFRSDLRGAAFVLLSTALPVTWLNFRAEAEGNDVRLTWSTASESNNEGFDIQRSPDGRDWTTIGFVPGAGTTSEVQNYSYTDDQLAVGSWQSAVYYRLKQKDYDGTTDYSPVRVVQLESQGGIRVFPNPVSEVATIAFGEVIETRGIAQLYTQENRLVAEYPIAPGTAEYTLRVAQLPAGAYLLKVKVGNSEWMRRLVVE